jgi:hypothetical protein
MVLCTGCGGSGAPARHDAGGEPDAMADARVDAIPDARDPTVRIRLPPGPRIDSYEVWFYSPRNERIAIVIAPHDGVATAEMPEGGTVLVTPDPVTGNLDGLRGLFGVKPGDDIRLFPPEALPDTSDMAITVPAQAGTRVYRAGTPCGDGFSLTTTIHGRIALGCQPPLPIVVEALDASDRVIGALGATSTTTTSATLAGPYLAPEMVAVQFTSGDRAASFAAELVPVVGNVALGELNQWWNGGPVAVHETATLRIATAPAAIVDARRLNISWSTVGGGQQQHLRVQAATDPTFTLNAAVEALPSYSGSSSYDTLQRKLTLRTPAGAVAAGIDGQIADLDLEPDAGQTIHWTLVIPPDVSEVVMPLLPESRFDPSMRFGVIIMIMPTRGIRASSYAGYDDFRRGVPVTLPVGSYYDVTSW